jgi:hypothetical protein
MQDITVGDTLDFGTVVPGFPASSSGYTLVFYLTPFLSTSGTPITLTAIADGDSYRVAEPPSTTATWTAGGYSWESKLVKTGERIPVEKGTVTLKPDPSVVASYDGRSPARAALDAINAGLATLGTNAHIQSYTIGSRSVTFKTQGDLLAMRDKLKAEVWREEAAAKMAAGFPNPRQVRVRFGRA